MAFMADTSCQPDYRFLRSTDNDGLLPFFSGWDSFHGIYLVQTAAVRRKLSPPPSPQVPWLLWELVDHEGQESPGNTNYGAEREASKSLLDGQPSLQLGGLGGLHLHVARDIKPVCPRETRRGQHRRQSHWLPNEKTNIADPPHSDKGKSVRTIPY